MTKSGNFPRDARTKRPRAHFRLAIESVCHTFRMRSYWDFILASIALGEVIAIMDNDKIDEVNLSAARERGRKNADESLVSLIPATTNIAPNPVQVSIDSQSSVYQVGHLEIHLIYVVELFYFKAYNLLLAKPAKEVTELHALVAASLASRTTIAAIVKDIQAQFAQQGRSQNIAADEYREAMIHKFLNIEIERGPTRTGAKDKEMPALVSDEEFGVENEQPSVEIAVESTSEFQASDTAEIIATDRLEAIFGMLKTLVTTIAEVSESGMEFGMIMEAVEE
ncbi:hypothetical protein C8R44DRAFT_900964 [Mycena epipterygia]|nr:hypothetical protein C8R44DRAFT_900964 [Mycena epipterygia]